MKVELSEEEKAWKNPNKVWINLILTVIIVALLIIGFASSAILFGVGVAIALVVNYPSTKVQRNVISSLAPDMINVVMMVLGAGGGLRLHYIADRCGFPDGTGLPFPEPAGALHLSSDGSDGNHTGRVSGIHFPLVPRHLRDLYDLRHRIGLCTDLVIILSAGPCQSGRRPPGVRYP